MKEGVGKKSSFVIDVEPLPSYVVFGLPTLVSVQCGTLNRVKQRSRFQSLRRHRTILGLWIVQTLVQEGRYSNRGVQGSGRPVELNLENSCVMGRFQVTLSDSLNSSRKKYNYEKGSVLTQKLQVILCLVKELHVNFPINLWYKGIIPHP